MYIYIYMYIHRYIGMYVSCDARENQGRFRLASYTYKVLYNNTTTIYLCEYIHILYVYVTCLYRLISLFHRQL